jgi:anti-sigma factor RsiW
MIATLSHPAQSAEFLSRLHDGELDPAEAAAFESHRGECSECEAAVADFERALAAYRAAPVSPHASDLSARILRKIRATSPSRRPFGVMFGIDLRWAGALAAALLVVIIGAPVFSRRDYKPSVATPASPAPAGAPIPAYVLDAEEERPAEKRADSREAPRPAAPKSNAPPSRPAAGTDASASRDLFESRPEGTRQTDDARHDEIAAANADKPDQMAATRESAASPTPADRSLFAAAPPAETKEQPPSLNARRRSAAAPVGGEAGAADEPAGPVVVKLMIQPVDGEGEAPEVVATPSDDRLAALRGRRYLLVVEAGGRVVAVEERPAGGKLAKDAKEKVEEADAQRSAQMHSLAETLLRELVFQPSDRARRLVVAIQ